MSAQHLPSGQGSPHLPAAALPRLLRASGRALLMAGESLRARRSPSHRGVFRDVSAERYADRTLVGRAVVLTFAGRTRDGFTLGLSGPTSMALTGNEGVDTVPGPAETWVSVPMEVIGQMEGELLSEWVAGALPLRLEVLWLADPSTGLWGPPRSLRITDGAAQELRLNPVTSTDQQHL